MSEPSDLEAPGPGRDRRASDPDEVLAGLEEAWERWVKGVEVVDGRTRSLLRAAFAAGYEAGHDAGRAR